MIIELPDDDGGFLQTDNLDIIRVFVDDIDKWRAEGWEPCTRRGITKARASHSVPANTYMWRYAAVEV